MTRILFLAVGGGRRAGIRSDVEWALDAGAAVTLVVADRAGWEDLDARAQLVELKPYEARHPLLLVERGLVFKAPRSAFGLARRLLGGRPSPAVRPVADALAGVERRYERQADRFHRGLFMRLWRRLRPFVYWRVTRRRVLPVLAPTGFDVVVAGDPPSIPVAWHLARRYPGIPVRFELDRARLATAS